MLAQSDRIPSATLYDAVVLDFKLSLPIAVFPIPVVLVHKAVKPTATLLPPVVVEQSVS